MASRWRSTLAVFLATLVVGVGIVVVVATSRSGSSGVADPTPPSSWWSTTSHVPEPPPTLTVDSGCRLGSGPESLTEVPASVTRRVDRAWDRIETWLAANAPVSAASLRPPADDEVIAETQRAIGVRLPAALVASLRRHDGVSPGTAFAFPGFMHPLPAEHIANEATVMCEVLEDLGIDENVGPWWHGRYVPIAADYGGDALFLDGERLGHHYNEGDVVFDGPAGLTDLLEQTADSLDGAGPDRPVVVDGVLEWR